MSEAEIVDALVFVPSHQRRGVIRQALGGGRYQVQLLTGDDEYGAYTDLPRGSFRVLLPPRKAVADC